MTETRDRLKKHWRVFYGLDGNYCTDLSTTKSEYEKRRVNLVNLAHLIQSLCLGNCNRGCILRSISKTLQSGLYSLFNN